MFGQEGCPRRDGHGRRERLGVQDPSLKTCCKATTQKSSGRRTNASNLDGTAVLHDGRGPRCPRSQIYTFGPCVRKERKEALQLVSEVAFEGFTSSCLGNPALWCPAKASSGDNRRLVSAVPLGPSMSCLPCAALAWCGGSMRPVVRLSNQLRCSPVLRLFFVPAVVLTLLVRSLFLPLSSSPLMLQTQQINS